MEPTLWNSGEQMSRKQSRTALENSADKSVQEQKLRNTKHKTLCTHILWADSLSDRLVPSCDKLSCHLELRSF